MLQKIEVFARISVARGCGFAGLAILTLMIGLSWDMPLALKVAGLLFLFVCVVLVVKALRAPRRPVGKTELWMMLDPELRPPAAVAQRVIGPILRDCYLSFALQAAALSVSLLLCSLTLQIVVAEQGDMSPLDGDQKTELTHG